MEYQDEDVYKRQGLYRALVLSPWAVAGVMVAIIWSLIYGETFGVLNDLLLKLGLIDQNISWFSDSTRAMTAVIIANVWRGIPFLSLIHIYIHVQIVGVFHADIPCLTAQNYLERA